LFQPLVSDDHAVAIPPHRLDTITTLVDEKEEMSIEDIASKHRRDDACESVKALAKIYRLRAEVNRQMSWTCQHLSSSSRAWSLWHGAAVPPARRPTALITVSIVAASASGRKIQTPLGNRILMGDDFDRGETFDVN
jgi:hypothetical protein